MKYFAIINDQQIGPLEINELADAGLMPDTYVWCKGMEDWKKALEVADICRYFRNRIHDKLHPSPATAIPVADTDPADKNCYTDVPVRYRRFIEASGEVPHPADLGENIDEQPSTWYPFPMLLALLMFPPLGIVGVINAVRSSKEWKAGNKKNAHEYARMAKMYGGVAFFIGIIAMSALIRLL